MRHLFMHLPAEVYFQYWSVPLKLESGAACKDRCMFADKTFMQTCFVSVMRPFLLLGEYKSTTAVLGMTKP